MNCYSNHTEEYNEGRGKMNDKTKYKKNKVR